MLHFFLLVTRHWPQGVRTMRPRGFIQGAEDMTQHIDFEQIKPYMANYLIENGARDLSKNIACPVCNGGHDTPCFHYYPDTHEGHCYSCGWHGDIINLIAEKQQISDREAAKLILERYEGKSPQQIDIVPFEKPGKPTTGDFTEYVNQCASNNQAIKYFTGRGLSETVIKQFSLGYDTNKREAIIPYMDSTGRCRWYTGRCDYPGGKYHNPAGYSRPFPFNGVELLRDTNTPIFVVEGEINALSVIECGFSAAGIGSTSAARLFADFVTSHKIIRPIILMLDNDAPGAKAQQDIAECLSDAHISFLSHVLPAGDQQDVNDVLRASKAKLEGILQAIYDQCVDIWRNDTMNNKELVKEKNYNAAEALDGFLAKITDPDFKPTPTGFSKLDEKLGGGLYNGLCLIAAAPSEGKSALAMQIAENIAEQQGRDILVFSFEMSQDQLMSRSLSRLTFEVGDQVPEQAMTALEVLRGNEWGKIEGAKINRLKPAIKRYKEQIAPHLYLFDDVEPTTPAIMATLARYQQAPGKKPPIIVVDYLQLMDSEGKDFIAGCKDITLALKRYAIEHDTIVIAISSVNREGQRHGSTMTNLYGSSFAEYGSDTLLMLDFTAIKKKLTTDKDELKRQPVREMTVTIAKNRMGATGVEVPFYYWAAYNHFSDTATERVLGITSKYENTSKEKKGGVIK